MNWAGKLCAVILCVSVVFASGCVSKRQYRKDMATLNSQIGTLSSEVYRIDSTVKESSQKGLFGFARKEPTPAPVPQPSDYSPVYRTPSGFEVPATNIQQALKNAGYYDGAVDGEIGPSTREAIRKFQSDSGLKADGICGRKTWELLQTHLGNSASPVLK